MNLASAKMEIRTSHAAISSGDLVLHGQRGIGGDEADLAGRNADACRLFLSPRERSGRRHTRPTQSFGSVKSSNSVVK